MLAEVETFVFSLANTKQFPCAHSDSVSGNLVISLYYQITWSGEGSRERRKYRNYGCLISMLITHFAFSPLFLHQIALDELTCTWGRLGMEINLFALRRLRILEAKGWWDARWNFLTDGIHFLLLLTFSALCNLLCVYYVLITLLESHNFWWIREQQILSEFFVQGKEVVTLFSKVQILALFTHMLFLP